MEKSVTVTKVFKASSTQLFQSWINPKIMETWGVSWAKIEAREGGKFRFETKISKDEVQVVEGEYLEIIPNKKIMKTWTYEGFEGEGKVETVVTAIFEELGEKKTRLTVSEEGEALNDPEYSDLCREAWEGALKMLEGICK